MTDGVIAGSPFPQQGAATGHHAGGARSALRSRHDRVAAAVRSGGADTLLDAARELEQMLAIARRDLGPRDPDTLVVEGTLACAYLLGTDETRGLELARRTLAAREQVLGTDHPAALAAADAVASALRVTGRTDEAVRRHEDVLTRRARVLGDTHPDTLASRAALALARADDGDLRGAAGLLAATVATAETSLGRGHPVAVQVRDLLAECREALAAPEPGPEADTAATTRLPRVPRVPYLRSGARPVPGRRTGPLPATG